MTPARAALAALLVASAAGCFDVRSLDRRFDAEVDAEPVSDAGPEVGARCARLDSVCDGVDEDCDGRYDEDFVGVEACGIGQCRVSASPGRCVSGFPIDCLPGMAAAETCDNRDNDCDGAIDEGLTRPCGEEPLGLCTRGVERCAAGAWGACDGVEATDELCDGRDQDCDGQVDEGLTRACPAGAGQCGGGVEQCNDGEWPGCDVVEPSPEQCNGVDDDCDGAIDEVGTRRCGSAAGECSQGEQACTDGEWGICAGEVTAIAELCNRLDDDCDGRVDEGDASCGACGLQGRPVCAVGVDPCPAGPPLVLCISEVGQIEGELGQELGRQLAAGGDADEDGIDDFVALMRRGVKVISGADASEVWSRNQLVDESGSLAVADLGEDARREVVVGDVGREDGRVRAVGPGSQLQGEANGVAGVVYGQALAAVDGESRIAVGDPTADDGQGVVRLLDYQGRDFGEQWIDIQVEDSRGFGGVIAMARDADDAVVLVATLTADGGRRVVLLSDLARMASPPVIEVITAGRGVGERLVMGPMMLDVPPLLAALNGTQPWVDVVEPSSVQGARLPLDDVGRDLALLPARGEAPPLLVVAMDNGLRFIRIDPEQSAMVADFPFPEGVMPGLPGFTPTVAASAIGPDGSRLVAIGVIGEGFQRGRVHIYRIE